MRITWKLAAPALREPRALRAIDLDPCACGRKRLHDRDPAAAGHPASGGLAGQLRDRLHAHREVEGRRDSKQQAQSNADSIQRNLTQALPALIGAVRSAPQDMNAEFKLYRNLNVLYDVLVSLTESAGAFGPRGDYDALARQLGVIDSVRRSLADSLENLTASTQSN